MREEQTKIALEKFLKSKTYSLKLLFTSLFIVKYLSLFVDKKY